MEITKPKFILTDEMLNKIIPSKLVNFAAIMMNVEDKVLVRETIVYLKETGLHKFLNRPLIAYSQRVVREFLKNGGGQQGGNQSLHQW